MQHKPVSNEIHCNSCGYKGAGKSNSAMAFMVLVALFCVSVIFLPAIVIALVYMVWILSKPATYSCPKCKSKDISPLQIQSAPAAETTTSAEKNSEPGTTPQN